MPKRVLLIDADVVAYNAAFRVEKAVEFEPGYWTWHVSWDEVVKEFDETVDYMMAELGGDECKLCLTDSENNFRLGVLPTYKDSRTRTRKPIVLKDFKRWLVEERGAYFKPGLEGDDCMGILATRSNPDKEERIIVSIDKDMKTIPGLFCRWGVSNKVVEISEHAADYWHLFQTLTGDVTDGYKGCPGVGPKKAEQILETTASEYTPPDYYRKVLWERVVEAFEKAGLTEADALVQARVARILRASDYDFKKKEPILWTPRTLAS